MKVKKEKKRNNWLINVFLKLTHWGVSGFLLALAPKEEKGENNRSNAVLLCIKFCSYLNIHFMVEWI